MKKLSRVMEHVWMVLAILLMVLVGYVIWTKGFKDNVTLLLLPAMAAAMWMFRRFATKRMAIWEEREKGRMN